ncbi:MAG: hypothetical protein PHQ61_07945 [Candidatus Omnitrophica bacterium]|nr:hypothetical protein [Candidatus Omnitrophota bacterium]
MSAVEGSVGPGQNKDSQMQDENSAYTVIESYWNGEAPTKIIRNVKPTYNKKVDKDW